MQTYDVEVTFFDGTTVILVIEAESEAEALNKAVPISFNID